MSEPPNAPEHPGRVPLHTALVDWLTIALAHLYAALLLRYRLNATWLILGGAVIGSLREVLGS